MTRNKFATPRKEGPMTYVQQVQRIAKLVATHGAEALTNTPDRKELLHKNHITVTAYDQWASEQEKNTRSYATLSELDKAPVHYAHQSRMRPNHLPMTPSLTPAFSPPATPASSPTSRRGASESVFSDVSLFPEQAMFPEPPTQEAIDTIMGSAYLGISLDGHRFKEDLTRLPMDGWQQIKERMRRFTEVFPKAHKVLVEKREEKEYQEKLRREAGRLRIAAAADQEKEQWMMKTIQNTLNNVKRKEQSRRRWVKEAQRLRADAVANGCLVTGQRVGQRLLRP